MGNPVRCEASRLALLAVVVAISTAPTLGAQRGTDTPSQARGTATVRAELAAVLLQSKKYDEAAREYRSLLIRDPNNFDYRLGLARALAWGGQPRDAERELRTLQAKKLQSATIDTLLRSVREAIEPKPAEAAAWVAERPDYAPYRLAFARALADAHYDRLAAAQYDTLLTRASIGLLPEPVVLMREQAQVYLESGNLVAGASSLRGVLRTAPRDTAIRHRLAVALARDRWRDDARAQYDTLISEAPTAALFVERARMRLAAGDRSGAESDLSASIPLGFTVPAYLMLGDLYRERGDRASARMMYRTALNRLGEDSDDRTVLAAALAQMAREDHPVAFAPVVGDDAGWRLNSDGVSDNLGVHYVSSTLGRTVGLGDAVRVGVTAIDQYLGERSPSRTINLNMFGGEASLSSEVGYGSFLGRVGVTGGQLQIPDTHSITIGSVSTAAWYGAWELALDGSAGPAYPSLLTTTAVRPLRGDDDVLTERSINETLGGPLGTADLAVTAQQTKLSDGNRRVTLQASVRLPLAPNVFAVYSANSITFSDRSTRYWDPLDYMAHGAGLEFATRSVRGFSWAARALPGIAWSREILTPTSGDLRTIGKTPDPVSRSAFQLGASGELGWRDPHWETTAAASFGRGRDGDYQRFGATIGVRIIP